MGSLSLFHFLLKTNKKQERNEQKLKAGNELYRHTKQGCAAAEGYPVKNCIYMPKIEQDDC